MGWSEKPHQAHTGQVTCPDVARATSNLPGGNAWCGYMCVEGIRSEFWDCTLPSTMLSLSSSQQATIRWLHGWGGHKIILGHLLTALPPTTLSPLHPNGTTLLMSLPEILILCLWTLAETTWILGPRGSRMETSTLSPSHWVCNSNRMGIVGLPFQGSCITHTHKHTHTQAHTHTHTHTHRPCHVL